MSWNDVVIGEGKKSCSAVKVSAIPGNHGVSENRESFWISDCICDSGITIFKDTPEGQELALLIKNETPLEDIQKWINTIVLRNIDIEVFTKLLNKVLENSYRRGKYSKAQEICNCLYLT
jgi:hypothetical protein